MGKAGRALCVSVMLCHLSIRRALAEMESSYVQSRAQGARRTAGLIACRGDFHGATPPGLPVGPRVQEHRMAPASSHQGSRNWVQKCSCSEPALLTSEGAGRWAPSSQVRKPQFHDNLLLKNHAFRDVRIQCHPSAFTLRPACCRSYGGNTGLVIHVPRTLRGRE